MTIGVALLVILLCADFFTGKEDFKLWTFRGYNEEDGYLKGRVSERMSCKESAIFYANYISGP